MSNPPTVFPDAQLAIVELLRAELSERDEAIAADAVVGTRTPQGLAAEANVREAPYVMVRLEGTTTVYPVDETATVRVSIWHATEAKSLALAQLCRALLLSHGGSTQIRAIQPLAGPIPTSDPESGAPLSFFTVAARMRPTTL